MKSFLQFLNEKQFYNLTLYHGYPTTGKPYEKFKDQLTFFSDKPQFATDYAYQKSFEAAMDADAYLYEVKFSGNLFFPWNMNEREKLLNNLPDKIKTYWSFGFDVDLDKQDLVHSMRAMGKAMTYDKNLKVGDEFAKDAPNDKYIVVGKDNKNIYAINKNNFASILQMLFTYYDSYQTTNYQVSLKYKLKKLPINNDFEQYRNRLRELGNDKNTYTAYGNVIYSDKRNEFEKLHKEAYNFLINKLGEYKDQNLSTYSFNIQDKPVSLKNTWNYFENDTVIDVLKKLGYDGYVSREDGYNTYAIFEPNKTVEIIKVSRA